jgi:hypothetical protein
MATKDVTTLQKKDMVMMFETRFSSNGTMLFNMDKTMTQGFKGVCHKVQERFCKACDTNV